MDLNGDGKNDILSGSYWPGDLFVFYGQGGTKYAAAAKLMGTDGQTANAGTLPWPSEDEPDTESLAAAPWAFDFDADGDLDLLVGNIVGHVVLLLNEGDAKQPKFGAKRRLQADGADIKVGDGDAGPSVADWDADGRFDLLVGAGDGSVSLFQNIGTKQAPQFAAAVVLIPASDDQDSSGRPGIRTKVHATDYDGDGKLDLLVGDFRTISKPAPKLEAGQVKVRDSLREQVSRLRRELEEIADSKEQDRNSVELIRTKTAQLAELEQKLAPLQGSSRPTGYVWCFPRTSLPWRKSAGG